MRFNKKLWHKFFKKRLYAFDLTFNYKNTSEKVLRIIDGSFVHQYSKEDGTKINIPDGNSNDALQVFLKLRNYPTFYVFLKCREICQKDKRFKLSYNLIIKALRD